MEKPHGFIGSNFSRDLSLLVTSFVFGKAVGTYFTGSELIGYGVAIFLGITTSIYFGEISRNQTPEEVPENQSKYSVAGGATRSIFIGFFTGYVIFFPYDMAFGLIGAGIFLTIYVAFLIYKLLMSIK